MLYKCKNCGGELHFDPSLGKLKCDFCDSVFDLSEYESDENEKKDAPEGFHEHVRQDGLTIEKADEAGKTTFTAQYRDHSLHENKDKNKDQNQSGAKPEIPEAPSALDRGFDQATDDTTDNPEDLRLYQCPHCGAEVVTDKSTTATSCIFCNTPLILQENMEGSFRPDSLIPFQIDKKRVGELYEEYVRKKPFYPDEYSPSSVIEKIKAVYLPFFLFDTRTKGSLEATGERVMTHTSGDWIITEHDVFSLRRGGEMDFFRIPVIASKKTPRDAMDSIEPYDYSKMVPFQTGYLPGFLAERYDIPANSLTDIIHERAKNTFDERLTSTLAGYSSIRMIDGHMNHTDLRSTYVLMPAYVLFMDYDKDEDALIAINGQTGKVAGNIPVDKRKVRRFAISSFLLIFLLFELLSIVLIWLI